MSSAFGVGLQMKISVCFSTESNLLIRRPLAPLVRHTGSVEGEIAPLLLGFEKLTHFLFNLINRLSNVYGSFDKLFPSVLTVIIVIHSRKIQEPMTTSHGLLINSYKSFSNLRVLIFLDWYACALLRRDGRWEVVLEGKARVRSENTKMAGKCLFRITSEWFLDYCIYQLWKEFRDKCSFSDCWKDRIQGKEELKLKSKRFWAAVFNTKVRKLDMGCL